MILRHRPFRAISIALTSRTLLFFMQLFLNVILPDHKSADAFRTKSPRNPSFLDGVIGHLFSGLNHWDSQYFIHITERGYDSEDKLVFLPLFPLSLRIPAHLVNVFSGNYLNTQTSVILSAFVMNTAFFSLAAVAICELTLILFKESGKKYAEEVVLWFCFNPGSIFFSATYSESLFSLLTFTGLCLLETENIFLASVLFSLSTMTRSNGLVNSGFLVYYFVRIIADSRRTRLSRSVMCIKSVVGLAIVAVPFLMYQQKYLYDNFCPRFSFCSELDWGCLFSLPYAYLQEKYWHQGFLRYWNWRQTHNFVIALPIISLTIWSSFGYFSRLKDMMFHTKVTVNENRFWCHPRLVPYAVHITFLSVYCLFFMHVQVAVRLLSSSSPWLYWMPAALETSSKRHDIVRYLFTGYFFTGIALFANGLAWT